MNDDPEWVKTLGVPRYEYVHWGVYPSVSGGASAGAADDQVLSAIAQELAKIG
jgi:hypothetical protein